MCVQHLENASRLDKSHNKDENTEERDAKRKRFAKHFSHLWHSRMRPGGGNLLHFLASQEYSIKVRLEWLMAVAINRLPHLMGVLDDRKLSSLSLAISVGNIKFSWAACVRMNSAKKDMIGEALKSECEERDLDAGVTCLHRAISSGLMLRPIQEIIKFAPASMFSAVDSRGPTPLHLAVEYSKGSPDQVAVVQLLLERGPAALKFRTRRALGTFSAYQYHERTLPSSGDDDAVQQNGSGYKAIKLQVSNNHAFVPPAAVEVGNPEGLPPWPTCMSASVWKGVFSALLHAEFPLLILKLA
ncbi:hypothetical protein PspLS_04036 [Pyricularia sp. CBS 133598]|nr:hypothetical protein PspLS_04036 [Pyricularia sp. CBS 133598]